MDVYLPLRSTFLCLGCYLGFCGGLYDGCHRIIRNAVIVTICECRASIASRPRATEVTSVLCTDRLGSQKSHFVPKSTSSALVRNMFSRPWLTLPSLASMRALIVSTFNCPRLGTLDMQFNPARAPSKPPRCPLWPSPST
ncbi:hypothetical protein JAAARDRAFT_412825 [Jaapia argillacea MUCL 33604]|uniref:Uncharacterized protein n=1 Tax=Jaapia argillacea MUCL 33604 TaxID=933084 RepID=A0A067PS47_9AGAM|nr:hypothetical protein JAAARDRAFT_412825 [Jaapia argillacea MUCL 33604]